MNSELTIDLRGGANTHIRRLLRDLARADWAPVQLPADANVLPNRQLIELRAPRQSIRVRASIYKVGDRGETHRLDERRVEITTTYHSGLPRLRRWADVVLGYDRENDAYVGLDPRRLNLGGETHNASSSVDPAALSGATARRLLIRPHETPSLGLEYQGIFRPHRLSEYLFNYEAIHAGTYAGDGPFSGRVALRKYARSWKLRESLCRGKYIVLTRESATAATKPTVPVHIIEAYEAGEPDRVRDVSPDELEAILRKQREVGHASEYFVVRYERKRLNRAGRGDLAAKISWTSQDSVGKGYDIQSFEVNGSQRLIEVKGTIGNSATFFMSSREWTIATRRRGSYWIYRVIDALSAPRLSTKLQDPAAAERSSEIARVPDGWRITLL